MDKKNAVLEQAVRWFTWLQENKVDPEQMDVFLRWRSASPAHQQAYDKVEALWQRYDQVDYDDLPWPTLEELQQDTYDGSYALPLPLQAEGHLETEQAAAGEFVLGDTAAISQQGRSRRVSHWLAAAASIAVLAVMMILVYPNFTAKSSGGAGLVHQTVIGQQISQELADGSTVELGGNSMIMVAFTESARKITLQRGEAFFQVAKDAKRPFIVKVGNGEVRAIGTAFNINKRSETVTVNVIEGVIEVIHQKTPSLPQADNSVVDAEPLPRQQLGRGQQIIYDNTGELWQSSRSQSTRASAWRSGKLAYVNESLAAVVEDINRYSAKRLVIGDKSLAQLSYSGTVFSHDIVEWLSGLQDAFPVRVLELDGQVVLLKS